MINLQMLEAEDILKPDDWCRPLHLTTMSGGQSDHYSFISVYSGNPENNVKWCKVKTIFSAWISNRINEMPESISGYEFIRGNLPLEHIHYFYLTPKEIAHVEN